MAQWVKDPSAVTAVAWVTAVARVQSLAWELPQARGGPRSKRKKKNQLQALTCKNHS